MRSEIVRQCGELLKQQNLSLAFAESVTSGRAAAEFSLCEQSGQFLKGSIVCYDAGLKHDLLKIRQELIDECSPESEEVTEAMNEGLRALIPADIHVSITGLACPGGSETPTKPVGTTFITIHFKERGFTSRFEFHGEKEEIILQAVDAIARLIVRTVGEQGAEGHHDAPQ